eukprot:sb/3476603/
MNRARQREREEERLFQREEKREGKRKYVREGEREGESVLHRLSQKTQPDFISKGRLQGIEDNNSQNTNVCQGRKMSVKKKQNKSKVRFKRLDLRFLEIGCSKAIYKCSIFIYLFI